VQRESFSLLEDAQAGLFLTISSQWGKDKTPTNPQGFDPSQQAYSPQSAQASAGYPGTPSTYFPQYGGT